MALTPGAVIGEIRTFAFSAPKTDARIAALRQSGWLECKGQSLDRNQFAPLRDVIAPTPVTASWGTDDPPNSFLVPNLCGMFLRGWNAGIGVDPDVTSRSPSATNGLAQDNVGSLQSNNVQTHQHSLGDFNYEQLQVPIGAGVGALVNRPPPYPPGATQGTLPPFGSETRPTNVYVLFCIFTGQVIPANIP